IFELDRLVFCSPSLTADEPQVLIALSTRYILVRVDELYSAVSKAIVMELTVTPSAAPAPTTNEPNRASLVPATTVLSPKPEYLETVTAAEVIVMVKAAVSVDGLDKVLSEVRLCVLEEPAPMLIATVSPPA